MEQAYVYRWTELSTGKWYIGSRTAKGCHPDDGYICTSKVVKPLIIANPDNWKRTIIYLGASKNALNFEMQMLVGLNAAKREDSYNQHNQDGKFTRLGVIESPELRKKKSKARQGERNPSYGKRGILSPNFGRKHPPRSEETRRKLSEALKGKTGWNKGKKMPPKSLEARQKQSLAMKGRVSPMKGRPNPSIIELNKKRRGIKRPEHSAWMTGRRWHCKKSQCPHCDKIGSGGNMQRYHFNNCKFKEQ
jgi:hypothetical protein